MFTIYFDEAHRLLRWSLHGHWGEETVRDFSIALLREILRLERADVRFRSLGDSSAFPRQSRDVVKALRSFAHLAIGAGGRKVAVVTGRPLSASQSDSSVCGGLLRFFPSEAQAEIWLSDASGSGTAAASD